MCQKLRKHNKNNFFILDSDMKDTLDCIFHESINQNDNSNQSNLYIDSFYNYQLLKNSQSSPKLTPQIIGSYITNSIY
jgi:hypothetical protein